MGRRKIEMKMVLDSGCRQVTFSKRRTGLFKKANELATLCGAEVMVIVFSPGGKPFSFGQPTVDSVANRYLSGGAPSKSPDLVRETAAAGRLNKLLNEKMVQFHEEKKRGEAIGDVRGFDLESLSLEDLLNLKKSLEELRAMAKERLSEFEASSTLLMLSNNHGDTDGDGDGDDDVDEDYESEK